MKPSWSQSLVPDQRLYSLPSPIRQQHLVVYPTSQMLKLMLRVSSDRISHCGVSTQRPSMEFIRATVVHDFQRFAWSSNHLWWTGHLAHSFQYVERERIPREYGGPQDSANCNQCCPLDDLRCGIRCYLERHDCTVENGLPRGSKFPIERVIVDPKTKRLLDGHNLLAKTAFCALASPHRLLFPARCT